MRKLFITLLISIIAIPLFGKDYLILRNAKQDTIWGDISFKTGKLKVETSEGKQKYKFGQVYEFQIKNNNYISVPSKLDYELAVRKISGAIDLYYSNADLGSISSTNTSSLEAEIFEALTLIILNNIDSYYLRKGKEEAVKVYSSQEKFLEYTAQVFRDDIEIYKELVNEKCSYHCLESILAKYNRKHKNEFSRIEYESKYIEENVGIRFFPSKHMEFQLKKELEKFKFFTTLRIHPNFMSECDSCFHGIGATNISDSMTLTLKTGLILNTNGDVPESPQFLFFRILSKKGRERDDVFDRAQYLYLLNYYEVNKELPYSEIDHLTIYRKLSTPTGNECINVEYRLKYNEIKKWEVYDVQVN